MSFGAGSIKSLRRRLYLFADRIHLHVAQSRPKMQPRSHELNRFCQSCPKRPRLAFSYSA